MPLTEATEAPMISHIPPFDVFGHVKIIRYDDNNP